MLALDILLFDTRNASAPLLSEDGLSASTLARLHRIQSAERRQQLILGRRLLAHAASLVLGQTLSAAEVVEGDAGYPLLTSALPVFANLSHSGPWLAAVACSSSRVGLDIEIGRARNVVALARRAFDAHDAGQVGDAPIAQQAARFHTAWTVREAAYKAGLRAAVVGEPAVLDANGLPQAGPPYSQVMSSVVTPAGALLYLAVAAAQPVTATLQRIDTW